MNSLTQKTVRAVYWSIAGTASKVLAQFFIQVWLVRTLGPTPYGEFASLLILISIGVLLSEGGFGSSLVQKKYINDSDIEYACSLVLATSTVLALLIYLNSENIAAIFGIKGDSSNFSIGICAIIIPIMAMSNISMALLRRNLRNQSIAVINLISYLFGFGCVGILTALAGWGSTALLTAYLVQATLTLGIGYSMTRHSIRIRLSGDRDLFRFGLQVVSTNSVNWIIENYDKYFIGRYWGTHDLGAYSVASNLSRTPSGILLGSIQPIAFSSASRVQDESTRLSDGYQDLLNLTALIIFPIFSVMHANANSVIFYLYGNAWVTATPLFSVMCMAVPLYCLLSVTGPILWATDNIKKEFNSQITVAVLLTTSLFLLRNEKISDAIWIIPALYLFRFLMIYRAISSVMDIGLAELVRSLRGGLVLAIVATSTNHIFVKILNSAHAPVLITDPAASTESQAAILFLLPAISSIIITLLVAMAFSRHLINPRIRRALAVRFSTRSPISD